MKGTILFAVAMVLLAPLTSQAQQLLSVELPDEIARVLRDYEVAWEARDADALTRLFTPEGFVLSGDDPHIRGRDAIRAEYQRAQGRLLLRAVHYAADGDVGFIIGAYRYDDAEQDRGKFVIALERREDGRWLIAADIDRTIRR